MVAPLPVREYASAAEMKARYAAIRRATFAPRHVAAKPPAFVVRERAAQPYKPTAVLPNRSTETMKAQRRADEIFAMRQANKSVREIAEHFGLTQARISQIMTEFDHPRTRVIKPDPTNIVRFVELYACGLTIPEIAQDAGVSRGAVQRALKASPDYRPRPPGSMTMGSSDFEIPSWVPPHLTPRFKRLAFNYGEEVAAGCIRNAKRMGIAA